MDNEEKQSNAESSDHGYFSLSRYDIFKMREGLGDMVKVYSDGMKNQADGRPKSKVDPGREIPRLGYHTLTDENMFAMIESVGKMLERTDSDPKKKKMSYSISPLAQALVKQVSDHSGATQGNIVELAPLFFGIFAQKSLDRRAEVLSKLEELKARIVDALSAMGDLAPHLKTYIAHIGEVLEEMVSMEKEAVEDKNYSGVNLRSYKHLTAISRDACLPPYYKEIEDLFEGDPYLHELFKNIVNL